MKVAPARRVAVVGAGASGLAAARALVRSGITPTVFERAHCVGGTWVYDETRTDAGVGAPSCNSMYRSLMTNLPKGTAAM